MCITVGLPFFNAEQTLADSIRAVFAQTITNWRLLLVDDGSTDGSLQIARAVNDPRVTVISDGCNLGLSARLNQIAQLCQTPYLARMDADDLMHPARLERQLYYLERHPEADLVGTGTVTIDAASNPLGMRACGPLDLTPHAVLARALYEHASVVGRTAWFQRHLYDEAFRRAQDRELWCRTVEAGDIGHGKLPEPLYFVREEGSASWRKSLRTYRDLRRLFWMYGPRLVGRAATCRQVGITYLKGAAWCLAAFTGLEHRLTARRVTELSAAKRHESSSTVRIVLNTEVPGLDRAQLTNRAVQMDAAVAA